MTNLPDELGNDITLLISDINELILHSRNHMATIVNRGIVHLYWSIGKRIKKVVLKEQRAEYGEQIVATLSSQLSSLYGNGFQKRNLQRMVQFYEWMPEEQKVVILAHRLSWSHFIEIFPIKDNLSKEFYYKMCYQEGWSVRTLRKKKNSMLFERTAISKKPDNLIKQELHLLEKSGELSPDLVFKNPYILDFLGLKNTYSESDLEMAILREIESFILELGNGFTFVARQKRLIIDGEDFYIDLLFYHRKLKRLIAIELKLGKFKAQYKGQMELYLRWLETYEMEKGEDTPLGLILCAEGSSEQIELLQLESSNIRVSEYYLELPPKELLLEKFHKAVEESRRLLKNIPK